MDPISAGLMVVGAGLKAYGAHKAGKQNKRALFGQAREEEAAGAEQELRIRASSRKAIGEQLAGQFSNGFLGGTGSALDALAESQTNALLDAMTVRREAAGRAAALRAEGRMRQKQGNLDAVGALIGGASSVYGAAVDWAAAKAPYQGGSGAAGGSTQTGGYGGPIKVRGRDY